MYYFFGVKLLNGGSKVVFKRLNGVAPVFLYDFPYGRKVLVQGCDAFLVRQKESKPTL